MAEVKKIAANTLYHPNIWEILEAHQDEQLSGLRVITVVAWSKSIQQKDKQTFSLI